MRPSHLYHASHRMLGLLLLLLLQSEARAAIFTSNADS
jgi:hypothetical protein